MTPEEQAARPSDEAFALIAACAAAHFYDGLCAECVDAAIRTARQEAVREFANREDIDAERVESFFARAQEREG